MLKLIRLYETSHIITSLLLLVMFEFLALAWTLETTHPYAVSILNLSGYKCCFVNSLFHCKSLKTNSLSKFVAFLCGGFLG